MKTLDREEAHQEFNRFWKELETEWFKVEVLQDYSGEDSGPSLKAWLEGDRERAIQLIREKAKDSDWADVNKDKKFKSTRIHIIEQPYSEYLLWEIEHYKLVNIPLAREEIFLVRKESVRDLDLPDGDFMIFDDRRVVRNYYTPDGRMHKADFYDKTDDISKFINLKRRLLTSAEPLKIVPDCQP